MGRKQRTIADRGLFKEKIQTALYKNNDIKELILGDLTGKKQSEIMKEFKDHVKSHLFIDDTIEETGSFIFYDVGLPFVDPEIKTCQVTIYPYNSRRFYGVQIILEVPNFR